MKNFDLKKYLAEGKLLKEGNITITHNDVTGDSKSTVIDVSLIDDLINRLQPIVGNKTIEINNKMREDFIQTIVRRLTGYTDMGGGNVRINENKPLKELNMVDFHNHIEREAFLAGWDSYEENENAEDAYKKYQAKIDASQEEPKSYAKGGESDFDRPSGF